MVNLALNLGLRYDYWHEKAAIRGNIATFDLKSGKAIAGEDQNGKVDLTAQPVAPFLAKATEGLWVPASEAGLPPGLFIANGYLSPRLGIAWRPLGSSDLLVRGGYGIFTGSFRGNIYESAIIGPPYWTFEVQGWSPSQLQRWEAAWPENPEAFVAPSVYAPASNVKSNKIHQWNVSIQKQMPSNSALTVSYVGNRGYDLITQRYYNVPPPGLYSDLQAVKPYPIFGDVNLYENLGNSWYDALQVKWERRFSDGLSYMISYAFSKNIDEAGESVWDSPTPFAPRGYDRGRSGLDRTHILAINAIEDVASPDSGIPGMVSENGVHGGGTIGERVESENGRARLAGMRFFSHPCHRLLGF